MVLVPTDAVGAVGMPVRDGLASDAFKSNAVCVAVEMGLSASDVLFTLPKPTMVAVMPLTLPVKIGLARGAFKSNAVLRFDVSVETADVTNAVVAIWVVFVPLAAVGALGVPVRKALARGAFKSNAACAAVEMGLAASEVLFTLPKPTMVAVMPLTVPVKVGLAIGAFVAIVVAMLVAKLASLPSAADNSFKVFRVPGAPSTRSDTTFLTNAVVAICVVLVVFAAVGAVGTPLKPGDSRAAFRVNAALKLWTLSKGMLTVGPKVSLFVTVKEVNESAIIQLEHKKKFAKI